MRRSPPCMASTGSRRTSRPTGRCCCLWTTCTGATARLSASSPTSSAGSRTCRRWSARRCAARTRDRPRADRRDRARPGHLRGPPRPLSGAAVTELVRARLGDEADERFCAACARVTGGNPLLLRQLLSSLEADGVTPDAAHVDVVADIGPRAVSRTVLLRLARLPDEAVRVARAVAVLGESADLPAVAALAELEEQDVADATGTLARVEILGGGAARLRAPAGSGRRLPGAVGRATRARCTRARPRSCATQAPSPTRWRRTCSRWPGARRNGSWTCWWRRPRPP